jgi:hypothetical protein
VSTVLSAVRWRPLVTFFVLAYAISYGFYLLSATRPGFPFLFPFGPLLAAIITASATQGVGGLRELVERCLRWRVGLRWYVAALLVPLAIGLVVAGLNTLLGAPAPTLSRIGPWYSLPFMFLNALIDAPLQENSGWHGYAMPRFPTTRSPLANTLILGLLLAGWHAPLTLGEPSIAAPYLITTVFSAVVTNWVYYRARQSALLAILYHSAANTIGIYYSSTLAGPDLTRYFWLLATANAVMAIGLVILDGGTWRTHRAVMPASAEAVRVVL